MSLISYISFLSLAEQTGSYETFWKNITRATSTLRQLYNSDLNIYKLSLAATESKIKDERSHLRFPKILSISPQLSKGKIAKFINY
jgi:hypothetical protein